MSPSLVYWFSLISMSASAFDQCRVKLDVTSCSFNGHVANITSTKCEGIALCSKHFHITHVKSKPYSTEILNDLLHMCCGDCFNSSVYSNLSNVSEITEDVMNTANFVFPVLGNKEGEYLFGYRFLPLVETPSLYFITYKDDNFAFELILSCVRMWPLFVICALMVLISGFICWLVEMQGNAEQFPRRFVSGWFEGIWWSFISITTVGYGDKSPTSVAGRLLSILWIIIGITSFSLITATLTSEIVSANSVSPPTVRDAKVGVIRHHTYEGMMVAKLGGIVVHIQPANMEEGIHTLVEMLNNNTIDGFLLDRYELMLFYDYFSNHTTYKHDVHYLRTKTQLTHLPSKDDYLYGMLVRDEDDYRFLKSFVLSNRDVMNSCTRLFLSAYSRKVGIHRKSFSVLFSTEGDLFWPLFLTCSVLVVLCVMFGVAYELRVNGCAAAKQWFATDL